jgi:hypothetical protein
MSPPRAWVYGPQWYFPSWNPIRRGTDQLGRRTIAFGWAITGCLVLVTGGSCDYCDCREAHDD